MVLLCCIIGLFAYPGKMQINSAPSARIYPSTKTYYLRRFKDELFSNIKVDIRYIRIGACRTDCGGAIVMGTGYSALGFMLVLHAVTLILSLRNQEAIYGSVWGVLTSLLAWIPFVGWALHLIAAILLMISGSKKTKRYHYPPNQL